MHAQDALIFSLNINSWLRIGIYLYMKLREVR